MHDVSHVLKGELEGNISLSLFPSAEYIALKYDVKHVFWGIK